MFRVIINCEHDKLRLRQLELQPPHAFNPAQAREIDVGEDDVWFFRGQLRYGALRRPVPAETAEALRPSDPAFKNLTRWRVVFDNGYSGGHRA
jgi:hypothetical protein